jgi:hypothetical protein
MNSGPAYAAHDLLVSAVDLTRACCANHHYLAWLTLHAEVLDGSAGIANYLASAALAFEEQAHPLLPAHFDAFEARDHLADILMSSAPLSCDELRTAVTTAIREAHQQQVPA